MGDACDSISTRKVVIYKLGSAVVERNVVEHSAYELHGRMQCGRRGQQPVPARLHAGQRPERRRWHLIYLISLPAVACQSSCPRVNQTAGLKVWVLEEAKPAPLRHLIWQSQKATLCEGAFATSVPRELPSIPQRHQRSQDELLLTREGKAGALANNR